jgi:hypothetical protein
MRRDALQRLGCDEASLRPVERNFAGVPADETELMVCGNAARIYGL